MSEKVERTVFFITDDSIEDCEHTYAKARKLYPCLPERPTIFSNVLKVSEVIEIFSRAAEARAYVAYSFANTELTEAAHEIPLQGRFLATDLFGPLATGIGAWLGLEPAKISGHPDNKRDLNRLYASRRPNGHGSLVPRQISEAKVVLVGLNLVNKKAVCELLQHKGIDAVSVRLELGGSPPDELLEKKNGVVVVLQMNIPRLRSLRASWIRMMKRNGDNAKDAPSEDPAVIAEESILVEELLLKHPNWRQIDVSSINVEEVAAIIEDFVMKQELALASVPVARSL